MADPAYVERLAADGTEAVSSSSAAMGSLLAQDYLKWKTVIEANGVSATD